MSAPLTPSTFYVQTGDGSNFISWSITSGATSYLVQRSLDGVTFSTVATVTGTPLYNYYLDNAYDAVNYPSGPVVDTIYYYQVAASNVSGTSLYTSAASVITTAIGTVSLGFLRTQAQLRCDRLNSTFVSLTEWNQYITEARKQLYNIVTQAFGNDYYSSSTYTYTTASGVQQYPLPPDFYKLTLVEVALNPGDANSWVTLRSFNWVQKNLWNYPNVYTFYGITNLRYRLMGNNLYIVPIPTSGQTMRIQYVPRPKTLMADTDLVDGISGWEEFIIVTAAMMALLKEESPTAVEFKALKDEQLAMIMESSEHRDIGEPQTVSDSKSRNFSWNDPGEGQYGSGGN